MSGTTELLKIENIEAKPNHEGSPALLLITPEGAPKPLELPIAFMDYQALALLLAKRLPLPIQLSQMFDILTVGFEKAARVVLDQKALASVYYRRGNSEERKTELRPGQAVAFALYGNREKDDPFQNVFITKELAEKLSPVLDPQQFGEWLNSDDCKPDALR